MKPVKVRAYDGTGYGTYKGNSMRYVTLVPAYGRDFKTAKEVKAAWESGKDFQVCGWGPSDGTYINKADAEPGTTYNIRFKKLANICPIVVK